MLDLDSERNADRARQMCGVVLHLDDVLYIINYFAVAALTTLRVYAVSALNRTALLVVLFLSMVNPLVLVVSVFPPRLSAT